MVITNIPADYGIEKEMNLDVRVQDNANNSYSRTYTFNSPRGPWLSDRELNGATEVLPLTDIRFAIRDDRAGVDPASLTVSIYNQSSGNELVARFSAPPLTGRPLNLTEQASQANTPDYGIHIRSGEMYMGLPFELPIPEDPLEPGNLIYVDVTAEDNESTPGGGSFSFTTRRACTAYPGCTDALRIYMSGGATYGHLYTHPELYITGAEAPFPYLDSGTVECGPTQTGLFYGSELSGDVTNPILYNQDDLYIQ